jgi:mannitol-specific phosphotransferase system IIBC component
MKGQNVFLHSQAILYSIFVIALAEFLYLGHKDDYVSLSAFILVGVLTSFFSKNMIVILGITIVVSGVFHFAYKSTVEGFEDENESDEEAKEKEKEEAKESKAKESKVKESEPDEEPDADGITTETEASVAKKTKSPLSLEPSTTKEDFGQDKEVVYSAETKLDKSDKMILAQEKLLERMNKYKPLLDTLNGLTKNIAIVKGMTKADE